MEQSFTGDFHGPCTILKENFLYIPRWYRDRCQTGCGLFDMRNLKKPLIFRLGRWGSIESQCGVRYISQVDEAFSSLKGYRALWNLNTITWDAWLISTDENVTEILTAVLLPDQIVVECNCEDGSQVIQVWEP